MSNTKCKIKKGMKGSNGGSRRDYTEVLKNDSKRKRREQGKQEAKEY